METSFPLSPALHADGERGMPRLRAEEESCMTNHPFPLFNTEEIVNHSDDTRHNLEASDRLNADLRRQLQQAWHLIRGYEAATSPEQRVKARQFADSFKDERTRP